MGQPKQRRNGLVWIISLLFLTAGSEVDTGFFCLSKRGISRIKRKSPLLKPKTYTRPRDLIKRNIPLYCFPWQLLTSPQLVCLCFRKWTTVGKKRPHRQFLDEIRFKPSAISSYQKKASLASLNNRSIVLKNSNRNNGQSLICGHERTQQTGMKAPFDVIPDNPSLASSLQWWPAIFHNRDLESLCQEKDPTGWPTERIIQRIKNYRVSWENKSMDMIYTLLNV